MFSLRQVSLLGVISTVLFFALISISFAHSTVSPAETQPSKYETFSLNVPTEREVPTTNVRLIVPSGLDKVTPFVKSGWNINIKKDAEGKVLEVEWSGGVIPVGQKDVFLFTGRTGTTTPTLVWKVYQSYRGGEVVAWDRDPKALNDGEEKVANPYSMTTISEPKLVNKENNFDLSFTFSILALTLSIIAFTKKK